MLMTLQVLDSVGLMSIEDLKNTSLVTMEELVNASITVFPPKWATLDYGTMPDFPRVLCEDPANINPIDGMMMGSTSYDAPDPTDGDPEVYAAKAENFTQELYGNPFMDEETADRIVAAYDPSKYGDNTIQAYMQYSGDSFVRCSTRQLAPFMAELLPEAGGSGQVYLYNLAYRTEVDPTVINGQYDAYGLDDPTYAAHMADLPLVFGTLDAQLAVWGAPENTTISNETLALSKEMMARWVNFAKTGDPNAESTYTGWDPVSPTLGLPEDDGASDVPVFVFQPSGNAMQSVPDKVEQCGAFFPPPSEDDDDEDSEEDDLELDEDDLEDLEDELELVGRRGDDNGDWRLRH